MAYMSKEKILKEILKPAGVYLTVINEEFVLRNSQNGYVKEASTLKELFSIIESELREIDNG